MIFSFPDLRRPLVPPPDRNPLPFTPRPSPGEGFRGFEFLGTAHFTRRSVSEAIRAVASGAYSSVALELDRRRFEALNLAPFAGPWAPRMSEGEFVAAADALGNREGNVWLIDLSMEEIQSRIAEGMTPHELRRWNYVSSRLGGYEEAGIRLWEAGREDEAMSYLELTTRAMERYAPTLHRALIEERNLIMASRLLAVAARSSGRVLVLVGMAHVDGIKALLTDPEAIYQRMARLGLNYSPPVRIRRVAVS
jgi:pheromone shutdown protein TraB